MLNFPELAFRFMSGLQGRMRRSLKTALANLVVNKKKEDAILTWQDGKVSLAEKGFKALTQLLKDLQSYPGIAGKFSNTYLEEKLREAINRNFELVSGNIGDAATVIMNEMLKLCEAQLRRHFVNVPVFGLDLFPHEMTVQVGDVEFYTLANSDKRRWMAFADLQLLRRDNMKPPGGSNTWAKVEVKADPTDRSRLQEECEEKTKQAMSALLLFLPAYRSGDIHERVYQVLLPQLSIWRNFEPDEEYYVYETGENQNYSARSSSGIHGAPSSLFISHEVVKEYAKNGLDRISNLLKSPTSELQKNIYHSLKLFWTAYTSPDVAISYLNYTAMLEMLVMAPKERSTLRDMPLRISWILAGDAKTEERQDLASSIKRLYSNRSTVAHGRALELENVLGDLSLLRALAFQLVGRLSQCNRYSTQKEVTSWVNAKIMGAPERFDTLL
jgi:hypothetical protein